MPSHALKDMHTVGDLIRYGFFDATGQMPTTIAPALRSVSAAHLSFSSRS